MRKYLTVVLWMMCFGALPILGQAQAVPPRTAAGCGPIGVEYDVKTEAAQHPVAPVEADKAIVYVFEDDRTGLTMRVGMDGSWVGATNGGSYFFFSVAPGDHKVCTERQTMAFKKDTAPVGGALKFTAAAGGVYYVRVTFSASDKEWGPVRMELADEAEGQFLIASSALSNSKPKK